MADCVLAASAPRQAHRSSASRKPRARRAPGTSRRSSRRRWCSAIGRPRACPDPGTLRWRGSRIGRACHADGRRSSLRFIPATPSRPSASRRAGGAKAIARQDSTSTLAEARFVLAKPPAAIDLTRFATLPFRRADRSGDQAQADRRRPRRRRSKDPIARRQSATRTATGARAARCRDLHLKSSYRLEGKIPMGIALVNKLRDSAKKVSDHIDFQSELASGRAGRDRPGRAAGS